MLATIDPNVTVALFAFLTALVTVVVPTMLRRMKRTEQHAEEIKNALGEKNGNGDAMQMLAKALGAQYELLKRMEDHETLDTARFEALDRSVGEVSGQVGSAATAAATAASVAATAASQAASLAADVARRLEDGKKTG